MASNTEVTMTGTRPARSHTRLKYSPCGPTWRVKLPTENSRYADLVAIIVLLLLTMIAGWQLVVGGTVTGLDMAVAFYPWFGFHGENLIGGKIPGWNPHSFSGSPFAADPQSGWMYLPVMFLFGLLPLAIAAKGLVLLHLVLPGLSTYVFARVLGIGSAGSCLSAIAYEFTGYLYLQDTCCFALASFYAWLPAILLGVELALTRARLCTRVLSWGLSGLALSQVYAGFLGQGAYYAVLLMATYIVFRTLLSSPIRREELRGRLGAALMHGFAVLMVSLGLGAAGILPRLEFARLSNLAGGYVEPGTAGGAWTVDDWTLLATPGRWYAGTAIIALALLAPLMARRHFVTPYWIVLSLCTLILAGFGPTPLHSLLYSLVPRFDTLHGHSPIRVLPVFYLSAAILAGTTLHCMWRPSPCGPTWNAGVRLAIVISILAIMVTQHDQWSAGAPSLFRLQLPRAPVLIMVLVVVLAASYVKNATLLRLLLLPLITIAAIDLGMSARDLIDHHLRTTGISRLEKLDLEAHYGHTGGSRFLSSHSEGSGFRYLGYAPEIGGKLVPYKYRWASREAKELAVNNRATRLGLQDVQGYNPVHIARYDRFITALNGKKQHYRDVQIFKRGLDSPLLDLLNARYVVVPVPNSGDWTGLPRAGGRFREVYTDAEVRVLENTRALPRAWIVHSARQVQPEEALNSLATGKVDARNTVLLEQPPPSLSQPSPDTDRATVENYTADRIRLRATTSAPGMLVLSEIYYPAWKAYVDGRPAPIYRANYTLRAVYLPEGEHTVELRYESITLRLGIVISLITYGLFASLAIFTAARWLRARRRDSTLAGL